MVRLATARRLPRADRWDKRSVAMDDMTVVRVDDPSSGILPGWRRVPIRRGREVTYHLDVRLNPNCAMCAREHRGLVTDPETMYFPPAQQRWILCRCVTDRLERHFKRTGPASIVTSRDADSVELSDIPPPPVTPARLEEARARVAQITAEAEEVVEPLRIEVGEIAREFAAALGEREVLRGQVDALVAHAQRSREEQRRLEAQAAEAGRAAADFEEQAQTVSREGAPALGEKLRQIGERGLAAVERWVKISGRWRTKMRGPLKTIERYEKRQAR